MFAGTVIEHGVHTTVVFVIHRTRLRKRNISFHLIHIRSLPVNSCDMIQNEPRRLRHFIQRTRMFSNKHQLLRIVLPPTRPTLTCTTWTVE